MSDQLPTAARVSDPGIRSLFRQENRFQAWLDVEAALAEAQAELGIIPETAALAIRAASRYELLDRARLDEGFARTGHPIVPFGVGTLPRCGRTAWRLRALGRDDAEHRPDWRSPGDARGASCFFAVDRRRARCCRRSCRERRRYGDRGPHERPACGTGDVWL